MAYRKPSSLRAYVPNALLISPPTDRFNSVICRVDKSFIYASPVPVLLLDASPTCEKEWGEPPSPHEIFSTTDLDEFISTDFSCLRFFVPPSRRPGDHTASQYDPYAEVHLSGVQSTSHVPFALLGPVPRGAEGGESLGPIVIPGFASEVSSMNSDAELYGEPHPKPVTDPRFERDHPSGSSSDADLYGSTPHNLSLPRGSDQFKSSQADVHHQLIRKFDTSTLLYVIPEVRSHSTIYMRWLEADNSVASFPSRTFCGSFCCPPNAYSTFQ
jgi:hypothetical protein